MDFDEELNHDQVEISSATGDDEAAERTEPVPREPLHRLLIRSGDRAFFLSARSIHWVEADDDFVRLHVEGQAYRIRTTMSALYNRLNQHQFLRINRSAIVNVEFIAELHLRNRSDYDVLLIDGTVLRLSRLYRSSLQKHGGFFGSSPQQ